MALLCVACGNTFAVDDRFCRVCGRVVGPVSPVAIANVPLTPAAPAQTSGKATASLVCGLLFFIPLAFVAAIVFGHLALSEIRKSAGRLKGEGLAIAGLVLGYALDGVNSGHFDNCCDRDTEPVAGADGSERIIGWGGDSADQRRRGYLLQRTHECGLHLLALRSLRSIDGQLASGQKNGYVFRLSGCTPTGSGAIIKYQVVASPITQNSTGTRVFCSDESNVIKVEQGGSPENCLANGSPLQ